MPLPKPRRGENKDEFVSRCIAFVKGEDPKTPDVQAAAICYTQWKDSKETVKMMRKDWHKLNYVVPIQETFMEGDDFLIRGTAINETTTRNGVKYIAGELEPAAPTLRNKPILKDHNNEIDSIVGRTTNNVGWNSKGKKIDFEGKIMDEKIKMMISDGRITAVSVGAMVRDLEEPENEKCVIARGIEFLELSLVAVPADPNAGFAKAIAESYDLKMKKEKVKWDIYKIEDSTNSTERVDNENKINIGGKTMAEDATKVEPIATEKVDPVLPKESTQSVKVDVDTSKLDEAIAKTEKLLELRKQLEATEKKPIETEEKKATKGKVGETTEEVAEDKKEGYVIEKSNIGKGFSIYKERK